MAVPAHSIDPRIFEIARKEFLANGFEKASLKACLLYTSRCV